MKKQSIFRPIPVLTKRMFRTNRGRNLVAILAILLTTMMFATLFTLTQSMSRNLVEMTFRQTGYDAQASMRGLTEEQADLIADHPDVVELGRSIVLGLAENQQLTGQSVEIRWANDTYAQHSYAAPTTGQMPQAADEIALDTSTLDRLGIPHELGQTVKLEWRKDLSGDEVTTSTFTLCGFWEGNQSSYSSMAWVSRAYADEMTGGVISTDESQVLGLYMVQVNLASDQNIEATMDRILADTGLTGLAYNVNLAYSPEMGAMAAQESMPMYLGMVLVFIAGYLIIYNIFQISVTADVQFYGKLKTPGHHHQAAEKADLRAGQLALHHRYPHRPDFGVAAGFCAGAGAYGDDRGRSRGFCQPHHLPRLGGLCLGDSADFLPAARKTRRKSIAHRGPCA